MSSRHSLSPCLHAVALSQIPAVATARRREPRGAFEITGPGR